MKADTQRGTPAKGGEASIPKDTNSIYSRSVTLNDLRHTSQILSLINNAFVRDGDQYTYERIQEFIRETAKGTNKFMLVCAFEKQWITDKEQQEERVEDEIVVGTSLVIGDGYKFPATAMRIDDAAGGYASTLKSGECCCDLLVVRPGYQRKGAAKSVLLTAFFLARHRLGYETVIGIAFETHTMIAWYRKIGGQIVGIMKHPNPQLPQDTDSVYLLFKKDLVGIEKPKF